MRGVRVALWCTTIVAAFAIRAAAATVSEDVRVPGGVDAFAQAVGVHPTPDRGRFAAELARLLYGAPARRFDIGPGPAESVIVRMRRLPHGGDADTVPVPLDAGLWSKAIFHRPVAADDLLTTILSDRAAALLCYGLAGLDDDTLQFLASQPALLSDLYAHHAPFVAVFADSIHVRRGAVVPPGGDAAVHLWEALVGERVTVPARFIPALFDQGDGRLAYLYDTIAALDPPHAAFALGLWINEPGPRLAAMQTLASAWSGWFKEWRVRAQPFARQTYDPAVLLARVAVAQDGRPVAPNSRELWTRVFEGADLPEPAATADFSDNARAFDAGWLIDSAIISDPRLRGERLDQLSFAQRVFRDVAAKDAAAAYTALRGFHRYRMLLLSLERMGVRDPTVYAAAVRRAAQLAGSDVARTYATTAQFQGALVLIVRMHQAGTLTSARAATLVSSLAGVPIVNGQYAGAILTWMTGVLCPGAATPDGRCDEAVLLAAAAGRAGPAAPSITWEGHTYRIDPGAAERQRIEQVRMAQGGPSLDRAFDAASLARDLSSGSATDAVKQIKQLIDGLPSWTNRSAEEQGLPPGVQPPPDPIEPLARAEQTLARGLTAANRTRAASLLLEAADELAGETLVSVAYALSLGDPAGPALVAGDISRRHDFGFGSRDTDARLRTPWMTPTPDASSGIAWHVDGSLLGLEVGMATMQLRRLGAEHVLDAPTLSSNQRQAFAEAVALMSPSMLTDASRDAIAAAIAGGERRLNEVAAPLDIESILTAVHVDGWRARAIRWTAAHDRARLDSMFSLREVAALGGLAVNAEVDRWGTSGVATAGCVCTALPPAPVPIWVTTGRPQLGLLASTVADLSLHVARVLADIHVPAAVAPFVLSGAVQDFVDGVRPTDGDDWLTLVRSARAFTREQIEDYIAAGTADGPLVPAASGGGE